MDQSETVHNDPMPRVARPKLSDDARSALATLGEPVNFAILSRLLAEGPLTRGRIAELVEVNRVTVQDHLETLRELGVIEAHPIQEPDGKRHRYEYVVLEQVVSECYRDLGVELGLGRTRPASK